MARPSRTAIHAHDPTYFWKFLLRVLAILFATVAIGTIAWATTVQYNGNGNGNGNDIIDDEYDGDNETYFYENFTFLLPWVIIALGLSIIWNIINIVILLTRNRWIHPGANVGCDLVLWLSLAATGSVAATGAGSYLSYGYWDGGYDVNNGGYLTYPNGTSYYVPPSGTNGNDCGGVSCGNNEPSLHVGIVVMVGCAFAFIVMLFHFALFISACRYTHSRRHSKHSAYHTRAVTEEATQIARRMIAEMTGPNGVFMPINNQQQHQPLLQPNQSTDTDPEMQRQPIDTHQQPMQQQPQYESEASNTAPQRRPVPPPPPPPPVSVDSPISETSNVAERWAIPLPPEDLPHNPSLEANTHPALRRPQDAISPV